MADTQSPVQSSDESGQDQQVLLNVQDLKKIYPDGTLAVDEIDFQVKQGEFCVIIGPSGCGKTTTLHSLIGEVTPTAGTVQINGTDVTGVPTYERNIGLVYQDFQLFPHLSVEENVRYGLERADLDNEVVTARCEEYLRIVDLWETRSSDIEELSAGQKQRVALARSLALEPALLLLDEPLGDLDYKLQKRLERQLLRIQRETETTFVYVTHDQTQAMRLADKIIVMNGGEIEQAGSVNKIYHRPATAFVATFVGDSNMFSGKVTEVLEGGDQVTVETPFGNFVADTTNLTSEPQAVQGEEIIFAVRPRSVSVSDEVSNVLEVKVKDNLYHPESGTQLVAEATDDAGNRSEVLIKFRDRFEHESDTITIGWSPDETILLEQVSVLPTVDLERDILGQE